MPSVNRDAVVEAIQRLFDQGTVVALGEKQLLDRFIVRGDQSAFEAIVGRHGPMVLSICRRVLDDQHDVEDAFQATFLILVKKAGSIRHRDVLGNWLYGVARRVAVRARTQRAASPQIATSEWSWNQRSLATTSTIRSNRAKSRRSSMQSSSTCLAVIAAQ